MHSQFSSGHFVVQKTTNLFSAMAIDQCHEQVNALIKSDGGTVGLTESPQALDRWMVAGPEIARVLLEFEASFSTPSDTTTGKHHEQNRSTQLTFAKDVISLLATFEDMGNPFLEDSADMLTLDTKIVMTKDATRTVNAVEHIGQRQMFFHAISGCDTVSSFLGRGKKSAWLAWSSCPSVTDAFIDLSLQPTCVNSDTLEKIERFIVIMYSRTCSASGVNGARKELFAQGSRTMENIPPTKAALLQHVRRAAYQAGYVWSQALVPVPVLPSPALWGWLTSDSGWKPFWTELSEASTACYELVHCGCKKGCRRQCKCRASNLQCT